MEKKCEFYNECRKVEGCSILGECVFSHALVASNPNPQAILNIHYSKRIGGITNALRKLKNGKPFNGTVEASAKHLEKIKNGNDRIL